MRGASRARCRQRGLSLLELVFAVFLVLTAVTYLLSLFLFGSAPQLRAQEITRTTMLAASLADTVVCGPISDVQPQSKTTGRRFESPFEAYLYDMEVSVATVVDRDGYDRKMVTYQVTVYPPKGRSETISGCRVDVADRGAKLFEKYDCGSCHMLKGAVSSSDTTYAPSLNDIGTNAAKRVPGKTAKAYIQESIRNPDAFIAPGYKAPSSMGAGFSTAEMPQADLEALTLFLLKK